MPKRSGIRFNPHEVVAVTAIRPLRVGSARRPDGYFFRGRIRVRPGTFLPIPGIHQSQRVFLKQMGYAEQAQREVEKANHLRELGLPVLKMMAVEVTEGPHAGHYIAMPPYIRRGGKSVLRPINSGGGEDASLPTFLSQLRPARDRRLIEQLARETALLLNNGYCSSRFDYYGFYRKKDGSWNHYLVDLEEIYPSTITKPKEKIQSLRNSKGELLMQIRNAIRGRPPRAVYHGIWRDNPIYRLFERELERNLKPELRWN